MGRGTEPEKASKTLIAGAPCCLRYRGRGLLVILSPDLCFLPLLCVRRALLKLPAVATPVLEVLHICIHHDFYQIIETRFRFPAKLAFCF